MVYTLRMAGGGGEGEVVEREAHNTKSLLLHAAAWNRVGRGSGALGSEVDHWFQLAWKCRYRCRLENKSLSLTTKREYYGRTRYRIWKSLFPRL